jgi:hypothetical protein
MNIDSAFISSVVTSAIYVSIVSSAQAQPSGAPEKTRENLMVVVRESIGRNKLDELPMPTGTGTVKLADAQEVEIELAWWELIGDTHIRFVFDGLKTMIVAEPRDLEFFNVSNLEDALALAVANVKRVYGEPVATPWTAGLMQVQGKSPDLDSTYFLDREFWKNAAKASPDGLVVAVPNRGTLLYAPFKDEKAVEALKRVIPQLHIRSDHLRVSSALYLFKDDKWSVFQAAVK